MKSRVLVVAVLGVLVQCVSSPAAAGRLTPSSLITRIAIPIEAIKFPVVGNFGGTSLSSIPIVGTLKLPLLGKGIPVVSAVTVQDGVDVLEGLNVLRGLRQ